MTEMGDWTIFQWAMVFLLLSVSYRLGGIIQLLKKTRDKISGDTFDQLDRIVALQNQTKEGTEEVCHLLHQNTRALRMATEEIIERMHSVVTGLRDASDSGMSCITEELGDIKVELQEICLQVQYFSDETLDPADIETE